MKMFTNKRVAVFFLAFLLSITSKNVFAYSLLAGGSLPDFNAPNVVLDLTRIAGSTMQDFTVNAVITDVNGAEGTATATLSVVGGTATPNPLGTVTFTEGTGGSGSDQITLSLLNFKDDDTGQLVSPEEGDLVQIDVAEDVTTWVNVARVNTALVANAFATFEQNVGNDANLAEAMGTPSISIGAAGNNQTGEVGSDLTNPVVATVTDGYGAAVVGLALTDTGDGNATFAVTDGSGQSSSTWTLGTASGAQSLTLSAAGYQSATANATATPGAAVAGTSSGALAATTITADDNTTVTVTLRDQYGNALTAGGDTVTIGGETLAGAAFGSVADNSDGTYTATYVPSTSGSEAALVFTVNGSGDQAVANVPLTVNPGVATTAQSTITPLAATTFDADTALNYTVAFKDQHSNATTSLGSQTLAASGETLTGATWAVVNNNDGTATATYTPSQVGTDGALVVTLDSVSIDGNQSVTVTPGAAVAGNSTATLSASSITADDNATITVTLKDQHSNLLTSGGNTITISGQALTGATLSGVTDETDGTYTATYTPQATGAESALVFTVDGSGDQAIATLTVTAGAAVAGNSTAALSASSISADDNATITVTLKDQHSNLLTSGGNTVTISGEALTGAALSGVTDETDGTYTATYTPQATGAESALVFTVDGSGDQTIATLTVTPGAAVVANSVAALSASSITADANATITVTLKDQYSNLLTAGGDTVTITGAALTGASLGAVSDVGDGNYTSIYTPQQVGAESALVYTVNGSADQAISTLTVTHGVADHMVVSVTPTTIGSNGSSTADITAVIKDSNENTVTTGANATATVTFSATANAGLVNFAAGTTDAAAAGEATVTVTSVSDATGGDVTLDATIAGLTQGVANTTATLTTAPYYLDQTAVNLLATETFTFTAEGDNATDSGTTWSLGGSATGSLDNSSGATSTYTAGNVESSDNVTITATISSSPVSSTAIITVWESITTSVTTAIGMTTGSTYQLITTGGDGTYTYSSSDNATATVGSDNGTITAVAAGTFTVTTVDDVVYHGSTTTNTITTAAIEVVDPLAWDDNTTVYLDTASNNTVTRVVASGGTGTFTYASANTAVATVSSTGVITAVGAGTTTITGTDATYSNITTSALTVTVSTPLSTAAGGSAISSTQPLASGSALSITPSGGTGAYTVAVFASPTGAGTMTVGAPSGGVYDITAPTTGAFAGYYTIRITDTTSGLYQDITVYVPMKVTVAKNNILESDNATGTVTITGAANGDSISFVILNSSGAEDTGGAIATFLVNPVAATNDAPNGNPAVATIDPADVSAVTTFTVQATNDTQTTDPPAATDLASVETGNMTIIPEVIYSGIIVDGSAAIVAGASITANNTTGTTYTTTSAGDGTFSISLPAKDSGHYTFTVSAATFITGQMSGSTYVQTGATANTTQFALTAAGMSISGDIIGLANGDIASVYAYYTSAGAEVEVGPLTVTGATAGVGDAYSMGLDASQTYNRIVATAPGYTSDSDDNSTNGFSDNATNIDLTLAAIIPEAFSVTVAAGPVLTFDETNAGTDISGYTVTAIDSAGAAVAAPVLTTNGTDLIATFAVEQDMTVSLINGAQVVFVYDHIDTVTTPNPTLDTAIPPVANAPSATLDFTSGNATQSLRSGFSATIGNDATGTPATNPVIRTIVIVLPATGINTTVLDTLNATSPVASIILTSSVHALVATNSTATGNQVVQVTLRVVQTNGDVVDMSAAGSGLLNEIQITMPFDTSIVSPGDLESGAYVIYTADTLADFLAGSTTAIPASDIISVDYIQGLVTFKIDHLSFFGIGAGSSSSSSPSSLIDEAGCFIATAAFGTYQEPHVMLLRDFRDQILLKTTAGKWFVKNYYHYSPPMADWIAKHDTARAFVRVLLLPLLAMSWFLVDASILSQMVIVAALMGMITLGVKAARTRHVRVMLKN